MDSRMAWLALSIDAAILAANSSVVSVAGFSCRDVMA
jgi:hypothetical protein